MAKKTKISKKRAERRDRARFREDGQLTSEELVDLDSSESEQKQVQTEKPKVEERPQKAVKAPRTEEKGHGSMNRLKEFFREVAIEARKINWPDKDEAWRSTMVVVITILFIASFMGLASVGISRVANNLFGLTTVQTQGTDMGNVPATPLGAVDLNETEGDTDAPADTGGEGTQ